MTTGGTWGKSAAERTAVDRGVTAAAEIRLKGTWNSYEEAMQNNDLPETQTLAADMAKLADGPPTFRNLDVIEEVR